MIKMENWKDELWELDSMPTQELDELFIQSAEAKRNDVGLINPSNGAGILIREDQTIEAFADYGLGFRIDPVTQSFSIFAPTIKLFYNKKEEISWDEEFTYFRGEYEEMKDILEAGDVDEKLS
ncbi:hypothetical protein [Parageobacillus galactosidasius]|nr:hypothetical protein [Parageobacillus galactosidasius]